MQMKAEGTYRPVLKDERYTTKRERRLGRVVTKQQNYGATEHTAKLRAEAKRRDEQLSPASPKRKCVRIQLKG